MATYPLEKVPKDDPRACPVCMQNGHITYAVIEGTERCPRHGGNKQLQKQNAERAMQYRVQVWQHRLKEFTNANEVKSLRDEIGVLRLLMEETLKRCTSQNDLLMFSARIQSIANDIQRLVSACDKLERSMGEMMDRPTAFKFAGRLIEIIGTEISDTDVLDRISQRILDDIF